MRLLRSIPTFACLTLLLCSPLVAGAADAPPMNDAERAGIEGVVHDYLMKHPEVIIQAVETYQANMQADKEKAAKDALAKRAPDLLHDPAT